MGELASFVFGAVAGIAALGFASWLVVRFSEAGQNVERRD